MTRDITTHEHESTDEDESVGTRTLALVSVINLTGFFIELAGGLLFGSVALISDAVHMLFDALAYMMAFGAVYTAEQYETSEEWSYGLHRLEPSAALLNGVLLIPMALYIAYEAYTRFTDPVSIDPVLTAGVAAIGLIINIVSVYILRGDEMSLNEEGAFYHLLGDTGASVAVIITMVLITVADLRIADPITAVLIAVLVIWSAIRVLRDSVSLLLERSPVPIKEVRSAISEIDSIKSVEDIHIWQICSQLTVATVRVQNHSTTLDEQHAIRETIHDQLADFGVDHATVELLETAQETASLSSHSH
ncbi:cation diffusion facilitator family transporter [Halococcus sp. AFM35]|uniref:cation diffusion facilitator family transporter n=1 Tax=Halococcus sp. AFM35 TaxID=3421653 RepID=UPI003EB7E55C